MRKIVSSDTKASPGRIDAKVHISPQTQTSCRLETSMEDYVTAVTVTVAAYRRRKHGIKNINQLASLVLGLLGAPYIIGHSMEASMELHGGSWSSVEAPWWPPWRSVEVSMEVCGGLHGGSWRSPWRSVEAPWGSVEASMEVRGGLHGGPWRSPWRSVEASMKVHGAPWRSPRRLMELRGGLHGVPDNVGRRLHTYRCSYTYMHIQQ